MYILYIIIFFISNINYFAKRYDVAEYYYKKLLYYDNKNIYKINYNLANSLYKQRKYNESIFFYKRSLLNNKYNYNCYYNIGNCLFNLKRYREAILYYNFYLLKNKTDKNCRHNINICKMLLNNDIKNNSLIKKENFNLDINSDNKVNSYTEHDLLSKVDEIEMNNIKKILKYKYNSVVKKNIRDW